MLMKLEQVIALLESIAPRRLAAEWDNVGLLVQPSAVSVETRRAFLTIDLTMPVMEEAIEAEADLIIPYHPPIFKGFKTLRHDFPQQRVLVECVRHNMAVYSPHTALDAAEGGVNDWLAGGLGPLQEKSVIEPNPDFPTLGQGRLVGIAEPTTVESLANTLKSFLGIERLRIAWGSDRTRKIKTIALCAGAGGSVISGSRADLYLTGEMRHHDVLDAVSRGVSVILSEHTHTERGYLPVYRQMILDRAGAGFEVVISQKDRDPIAWG